MSIGVDDFAKSGSLFGQEVGQEGLSLGRHILAVKRGGHSIVVGVLTFHVREADGLVIFAVFLKHDVYVFECGLLHGGGGHGGEVLHRVPAMDVSERASSRGGVYYGDEDSAEFDGHREVEGFLEREGALLEDVH